MPSFALRCEVSSSFVHVYCGFRLPNTLNVVFVLVVVRKLSRCCSQINSENRRSVKEISQKIHLHEFRVCPGSCVELLAAVAIIKVQWAAEAVRRASVVNKGVSS